MSEPKAQHYIPKFYLKGFTDKHGSLWVYEKFKAVRESKPKHEALHPDYYTHTENEEREQDETAEDTLEQVESRAAPVVCKLANRQFTPSPAQMGRVYLFIAFMFARVPTWRDHLDKKFVELVKNNQLRYARDRDKFYESCADFEKTSGKSLGMDYEKLRQYVLSEKYEIVQESTAFKLGSMFKSALAVADEIQKFSYEVLYAPEGDFFLTSDSPVFTVQPDGTGQVSIGMGFAWPDVLVHFPLNKRACLRLRKGINSGAREISHYDLTMVNRITMMNAGRCLYSSESYRRISRLFDEFGCKIEPGKNAFMPAPQITKAESGNDARILPEGR